MAEFNGFTEKAGSALNLSIRTASLMGHTYVGSEHIVCGLMSDEGSVAEHILSSQGIRKDMLINKIERSIGRGIPTQLEAADFTPRSRKILENAFSLAKTENEKCAGTEHILYSLLSDPECYGNILLRDMGVDIASGMNDCISNKLSAGIASRNTFSRRKSRADSVLEKYGKDLTILAEQKEIDPVIGREDEIQRTIQILLRRRKNNPCLIGESGVGKTAIVEGLALKIVEGNVPECLKNKRIFILDITSMVAGAKYRGDFEERIKSAIDEVAQDKETILFIDEVHNIVGAGSAEGSVDAANILKPLLARSEIQVIGATTNEEYRRYIEKDSALERRFQPILVEEPDQNMTEQILFGLRERYEKHHKVIITDEAIKEAVKLSIRYIKDRRLPDKAIDIIDESAAVKHMQMYSDSSAKAAIIDKNKGFSEMQGDCGKNACIVDKSDIAKVVSRWSGIPIGRISSDDISEIEGMEEEIKREVIGQDEAVEAVVKAIKRSRAGLKSPNRPIGSFIFLGPTGVGKTQLCKSLAKAMFGDEKSLIRLDMSEYKEKHSISKLIGSPPGYVGFENGGRLIEAVRKTPFSVIMLDEIEKAHPDVFDLLLQILEDGVLTSSDGRTADFKNSVVIMTGNIGAEKISENSVSMGFNKESDTKRNKSYVMSELKKYFKPEFLNRIDEIIIFEHLSIKSAQSVCRNMLDDLCRRALDTGIFVSYTDTTVEKLTSLGYNKLYGARPIRRIIVSKVEDRLAQALFDREIRNGETIVVDYKDDIEFIHEKQYENK